MSQPLLKHHRMDCNVTGMLPTSAQCPQTSRLLQTRPTLLFDKRWDEPSNLARVKLDMSMNCAHCYTQEEQADVERKLQCVEHDLVCKQIAAAKARPA